MQTIFYKDFLLRFLNISHAEESGDYGTRQILREILDSEEEHVDWIEKQIGLIEKVGEQNYIQSQT